MQKGKEKILYPKSFDNLNKNRREMKDKEFNAIQRHSDVFRLPFSNETNGDMNFFWIF